MASDQHDRPPPAPPCLAPVHLQLAPSNVFPGTSFQLLSLPPRLYLFPYLSLFSTLLYFSRILKRKPSRWKQVERTCISNSCALQPFTISIHDTLVSSLLSSSRSLEGKRRNAQTGRIWTRTGHEEEKRREERTSNGHVAGTRHSVLPLWKASRTINHGRVLRFCRASRPTCVPRTPLFRV